MTRGRNQFSELELSAVREIANIGLGHATTALSELTQKPFQMSVPHADTISLSHAAERLGNNETECSLGIYMPVDGEIGGHMAFLFNWEGAKALWTMLLGFAPEDVNAMGELEASAMTEIGNIINSSFLNAVSELSGFELHATPPMLAVDSSHAILNAVVAEASQKDSVALALDTSIYVNETAALQTGPASGLFLFIPTASGLTRLFEKLGIAEAA